MLAIVVAIICLLLIGGCRTTHYELELRPEQDGLHRTLLMWVEDDEGGVHLVDFPREELERVAAVYGAPVPVELAAKHVFQRTYPGEMPDDLNNSGWYYQRGASMGSVAGYLERFGDDDIAADLETRELALNRLVDIWIAWLDSEFEGDPDYSGVRSFVDGTLRDDLWDVALHMWGYDNFAPLMGQSSDDDLLTDWAVRLVAYLADRGYVDLLDLERIFAAAAAAEEEDPGPILDIIAHALANKMGVPADEPLPGPLVAMCDDLEKFEESFDAFVDDSEVIHKMVEKWDDPPQIRVDVDSGSSSIAGQLTEIAFMPGIGFTGGNGHGLSVTLHLPVEPLETNGDWDDEGTVEWRAEVSAPDEIRASLPDVLFAAWAKPDVAFQTKHFGKVVLEEYELLEYLTWKAGLNDKQVREWDRFVAKLRPGPNLATDLHAFCFKSERETCDDLHEDKLAHGVTSDIVRNLQPKPPEEKKARRSDANFW
jgi:hypothetical protein